MIDDISEDALGGRDTTIVDENENVQVLEVTDLHPYWVVTDEPDLERAAREYVNGMWHENIAPGLNGFWVEAKDWECFPFSGALCGVVNCDFSLFFNAFPSICFVEAS
jgi:hypothetical protein